MSEKTINKEYFRNEIKSLMEKREEASDWAEAIVINKEDHDNVPVGASKMGGLPDLPKGVEYPECEGYTDEKSGRQYKSCKLPLICQFDLADLAEFDVFSDMPENGMLYIFWNGEDPKYSGKKYDTHPLRAYYWKGDKSALIRCEADSDTEVRPEKKISFSKCRDTIEMNDMEWESLLDDLRSELEYECKNAGIDCEELEEYKQIEEMFGMSGSSSVYDGDKLSGFKAGCNEGWNSFLQLEENTGSLWYSYIDIHFLCVNGKNYCCKEDIQWQEWNEFKAYVDYDAD